MEQLYGSCGERVCANVRCMTAGRAGNESTVIETTSAARPAMTVTRHTVGRRTVLAIGGEIDLGTIAALGEEVDAALGNGAAELWIDLGETEFLDSTGLHLLLDARRRADALNRRLAIVCPAGPVRRVFQLAGLAEQLPVFGSRAEAHRAG
jgi:anti-sigma B factor antagonist